MKSGNPALNKNTFLNFGSFQGKNMTLEGTVHKTMIMFVLLVITAAYTWVTPAMHSGGVLIGALIVGLIVALVTIFKKEWAPITAPLYALVEGVVIGAISLFFESIFPGIVLQAVFLTFGVFVSLLLAYQSRLIQATENFKLGIVAATGGIMIIYLVSMVLGFFGTTIPLIHEAGPVGIIFSLIVVTIAALNLVLDFDFIENAAKAKTPKYMEWVGAFGLMVTLIWLYIEILHLLSKLRGQN